MDPAIQALLKRLQGDYEAVMAADNPARAAREWAGRMRQELMGPSWTAGPAADGERPAMSAQAVQLLDELQAIERNGFWTPDSLVVFRAAAGRLL
ncbi:MAG: hypothetical protein F4Z60_12260 [Chloroflexi bacterium]|nr:hypothetical protein [Chloroflexota bacterium]